MNKKDLIIRIARWALQLEEFDYEIEHRSGKRMQHLEALSRHPIMIIRKDTLTEKLKKAQDEDIQTFKSLLKKQESEEFFERNGMFYKYLNGRELTLWAFHTYFSIDLGLLHKRKTRISTCGRKHALIGFTEL
ncbi:hypothetical protein AVEN_173107-1 [Araneus ventricosus]|uniref:Reverse transcriptase RNase H-like domain-containing protein n=1 Tax=Araneus ventricosus TaxID=182803 RepID=A0A4Y2FJK6_ARAVE|nr:hypothetical protein AVEN_173107-1 [Araneus ventricosus]